MHSEHDWEESNHCKEDELENKSIENNNFELSKKDCEQTNCNYDEDTLEDSNAQNVKYDV